MAGASQSDSSLYHKYVVTFQIATFPSMGCDPFFEKAGAKVLHIFQLCKIFKVKILLTYRDLQTILFAYSYTYTN